MQTLGGDPLRPSQYAILQYLLHLSDRMKAPGTALNYLSGARIWVRALGGSPAPFDAYPVTLMKRGLHRASSHHTRRAPALTPALLADVQDFLQSAGPNRHVLTAALLLGYATLLRQSNLLLSTNPALHVHALRARDVTRDPSGLLVHVRSTKTIWRAGDDFTIEIPARPDARRCPVAAWDRYASRRRMSPDEPAFVLAPGRPLRAPALLSVLRLALAHAGAPVPEAYTLHSLRRGGAQACVGAGASLDHVKALGSWSSDAVHAYVPRAALTTTTDPLP